MIGDLNNLSPVEDMLWIDNNTQRLMFYDGDNWNSLNTYASKPIDLTNATSDYMLQAGESAIINFTNATSVPLHIAVDSNAVYELYNNVSGCKLLVNNTAYSSSFVGTDWGVNNNGSSVALVNTLNSDNGFYLGNNYATGFIVSYIDTKNFKTFTLQAATFSPQPYSTRAVAFHWSNPVPWTSLGTITFLQSLSGYILVRRLV